jgi:acyl-CoA synthetase (AMP-forming)/AMP-acid ligase II
MDHLAATGGVPGPGRIGRVGIGDLLKRAAQRFPDRIAVTDGARHCRKSLGGFQVPKMIRILDDMPMTATGKLGKVELRQAYGDYFAAKSA